MATSDSPATARSPPAAVKRTAKPAPGKAIKKRKVEFGYLCPQDAQLQVEIHCSDNVVWLMKGNVLRAASKIFRDKLLSSMTKAITVPEISSEIEPLLYLIARFKMNSPEEEMTRESERERAEPGQDKKADSTYKPWSFREGVDAWECDCACGPLVGDPGTAGYVHDRVEDAHDLLELIDVYQCLPAYKSCVEAFFFKLLHGGVGHYWPILCLAVKYCWLDLARCTISSMFRWVRSDLQFQYLPAFLSAGMVEQLGGEGLKAYQRAFAGAGVFAPGDLEGLQAHKLEESFWL